MIIETYGSEISSEEWTLLWFERTRELVSGRNLLLEKVFENILETGRKASKKVVSKPAVLSTREKHSIYSHVEKLKDYYYCSILLYYTDKTFRNLILFII